MDTVHHTKPQTTDPASRRTTDNDRAAEQGDPAPHRRRGHLPQPAGHRSPRRGRAGRTDRRMGRRPPLPRPRSPRPLPTRSSDRHDDGGEHRPRPRTQRLTPTKDHRRYTTTWDLTCYPRTSTRSRAPSAWDCRPSTHGGSDSPTGDSGVPGGDRHRSSLQLTSSDTEHHRDPWPAVVARPRSSTAAAGPSSVGSRSPCRTGRELRKLS